MGNRLEWWRDGKRRCSGIGSHGPDAYMEPVAFAPVPSSKTGDGLDIYCRECRHAANRRYYERHREADIADTLEWRRRNRRRYLTYMRRYHRERQAVARLTAELAREEQAG